MQQLGSQLPDEYDNPPPPGARIYSPDGSEGAEFDDRVFGFIDTVERAAALLKRVALCEPAVGLAQIRAEELFGPFVEHPMPSHRATIAPK